MNTENKSYHLPYFFFILNKGDFSFIPLNFYVNSLLIQTFKKTQGNGNEQYMKEDKHEVRLFLFFDDLYE